MKKTLIIISYFKINAVVCIFFLPVVNVYKCVELAIIQSKLDEHSCYKCLKNFAFKESQLCLDTLEGTCICKLVNYF